MKNLLKAFLKTSGGSVLAILFGIITTKITALVIGPAGVGLYSLLKQTQQTLLGVATLNGNTALVQGLSVCDESDKEPYKTTIATLLLVVSGIISIIIWLAAPNLALAIFNSREVETTWLVRGLIPPLLFSVGVMYLGGVLNSYRAIGRLALVQVIGSALSAVTIYPLLVWIGTPWGLLFQLWITSGNALLISILFTWRGGWLPNLGKGWYSLINYSLARKFLKFAGVTTVTGLVSTGMLLLVRIMFVRKSGLASAGHFDVAWTLSTTYLTILLSSLGTYYMPVLAASKDLEERSIHIKQVFRIMLLFVVPLITMVILGKSLVISLLYTKDFLPALKITQYMLIGDYFKAISWVLAMPVLAFADMKVFFWTEMIWNLCFILGCWVALYVFKVIWIVGLVFLLLFILNLLYYYRYTFIHHNLYFTKHQLFMWFIGLIIILTASIMSWGEQNVDWLKVFLFSIVLIVFIWFGISKREREMIFKKLVRR